MLASRLGDIALIVLYGALAIIAIALLMLVISRQFQQGEMKVGPMEVKLNAIEDQIRQVNHAVNQVAPDTPTLVNRVARIEEINRHLLLSVRIIAGHVGADIPPLRDEDGERRTSPQQTPTERKRDGHE